MQTVVMMWRGEVGEVQSRQVRYLMPQMSTYPSMTCLYCCARLEGRRSASGTYTDDTLEGMFANNPLLLLL